jgi:hypothetical protein
MKKGDVVICNSASSTYGLKGFHSYKAGAAYIVARTAENRILTIDPDDYKKHNDWILHRFSKATKLDDIILGIKWLSSLVE